MVYIEAIKGHLTCKTNFLEKTAISMIVFILTTRWDAHLMETFARCIAKAQSSESNSPFKLAAATVLSVSRGVF